MKRATQSVRRLVQCDESTFQVLALVNALGLARGQSGALQFTGFAAVSWWMALICTVMAVVIGGWYVYKFRHTRDEPIWQINLKKSLVKPKRVDVGATYLRACQRHQTLTCGWLYITTPMTAQKTHPTRFQEMLLQNECFKLWTVDEGGDTLRNTAIAAWLLGKVNRRLSHATLIEATVLEKLSGT